MISLKEAELTPDEKDFNKSNLPVAVLLEGSFSFSIQEQDGSESDSVIKILKLKLKAGRTKLIVIADADIIRNEVRRAGLEETPLPLGQDKYTGQMFGNRDFLINCLNYLVDDNGAHGTEIQGA